MADKGETAPVAMIRQCCGVTLLAFIFLGDGLHDAMDPHMKK